MDNVTTIEVCYQLNKQGIKVKEIVKEVEIDRATVYRWIKGLKEKGKRRFTREYKAAKKGRKQPRKTCGVAKSQVYYLRKKYRQCCGQKIQYLLKREYGREMSISTIYRILREKYHLRSKWKKNKPRGKPIRRGEKAREYIQVDTVDFGGRYAFTAIDTYTKEVSVRLEDRLDAKAGERALKQLLRDFRSERVEYLQRDGGSEFKAEWQKLARKHSKHLKTSRPYKKNDQAFIEKFNATLRKECLGHTKYRKKDFAMIQQKLTEFLFYYHYERPHLSLNFLTPFQKLALLANSKNVNLTLQCNIFDTV